METIVKVIDSNSFSGFRYPFDTQGLFTTMTSLPLNLRPRHFDSAFNLEQFCRDTVLTIWHYHGGCQVDKVVDKDYKVMGVDSLRVVDGSTYYGSPGTNPQATCMMLGRYVWIYFEIKLGTYIFAENNWCLSSFILLMIMQIHGGKDFGSKRFRIETAKGRSSSSPGISVNLFMLWSLIFRCSFVWMNRLICV